MCTIANTRNITLENTCKDSIKKECFPKNSNKPVKDNIMKFSAILMLTQTLMNNKKNTKFISQVH